MFVNNFFWRTYDQQEIDWVEERDGNLFGYEIKWSKKNIKSPPRNVLRKKWSAFFASHIDIELSFHRKYILLNYEGGNQYVSDNA